VLFSMASRGDRTRLVELQAIDPAFPLYGDVVLEGEGPAGALERAALVDERGAWIDPALLGQLGVRQGEELRIGALRFRVTGVIARDGGRATSGFSIAPRIYVSESHLASTGLVTLGSRVQYRRLYRQAGAASGLADALRVAGVDPQVSVRSHEQATRDLARAYSAVSDYLGLVALIAIFLAGIGSAHLFRAYLARRVKDIAILVSLGASRAQAQRVFLLNLALLSAAAAALACGAGALLAGLVPRLAGDLLPPGFELRVGLRTLALVAVLAVIGSAVACLPLLARLRELRPAELFAEHVQPRLGRGPRDALWLAPALLAFVAVAVWRVGSLAAGGLFASVFFGSLVLLAALGLAGLRGLAALPARDALALRLALRELVRNRASSLSGFLAIALSVLLLGIAPQLRGVLDQRMRAPDAGALPSLFLFDIQPEQRDALAAHVAERGARLERISPMVRARLDAIDGVSVAEGVDQERMRPNGEGQRLRTRRYNLTYRERLTASETLREGRDFSGPLDPAGEALPEISLELDFARRLGVGPGATLAFDVQGVPVEGRVVNLREVRWNSFQPNFFVAFQPGVLEGAPKIFLASIPELPAAAREALQASISEAFPNVSSVDVTRAVRRLLGLIGQLQWALSSTASLSLCVGLVLVFAVARDQARARRWETNLLKVLGADFRRIRQTLDLEFGVLGLLGAVAGSAASVLASALLSHFLLEASFRISPVPLLATLVGVPALTVLTGRLATRRVLRERPLALLQTAGA
jgi:putative ABC transport system permease protein